MENDVCETEELLLGPLLLVWLRRGFRGRDAAVHGMPRQAYAGIGGGGSGGDGGDVYLAGRCRVDFYCADLPRGVGVLPADTYGLPSAF